MGFHQPPRILLCSDAASDAGDVRHTLRQAQYYVDEHALGPADPGDLESYQAAVVNAAGKVGESLALCQRLRGKTTDGYLPTLLIATDPTCKVRLAGLECGVDAYLPRPFNSAELLAQVRVLLQNKQRHDRLTLKSAEIHRINRRLQQAYQQIDEELELAKRIQESFLPRSLPDLPGIRLAVHYQPCGRVGGDFYDVFRLDEQHVGFYVADAMGHGMPASLLTIFIKTGVRPKEINGHQYRLVPPDEVLQRLNKDLIQQQLADTPFITMVYALFNFHEKTISFSRSGHPYPVHLPREGEPQAWPAEGSLLGVFETRYTIRTEQLKPGDKLLLYTDGIDAAEYNGAAAGLPSLLAYAASHRELPIDELVRVLPQEMFKTSRQTDDLTVLGLEVL